MNDDSSLFPAPGACHDAQYHREVYEVMGMTYPTFQAGGEDLHVGDMLGRLCAAVSCTSFKFPL